ncbi:MAG TPA: Do family serine endopeptidase [Vitreimonas sp.]|uniref:Do family serine endopeptidase n=1 Tax=Vitreimonas sp. TaxID=3069702 RepID=UPI002D6D9070|nr:Do family serine endopeptidase [Vitreimonas sp.]HYD89197.1 Do family serine endopeptidase [Vitreimonas sp.]
MTDAVSMKYLRRTAIASGAALALFTGFALAPMTSAQEINPGAVAPPSGAPMSFANLIERVSPAVVSISVRQRPGSVQQQLPEGLPPGFEEFFRGQPGRPGPAPTSLGSGFFIDQNGTIVTNHHVIEGAEEITVRTSDGRELQAELVGSDEATDIAVIRVTERTGRFPFVRFDDARHVRVGDWVVAVGNPFGLEGTATAGIVSAIGRRDAGTSAYVDYMQIDAPINRGNSGGPTFDINGNVIGVNTLIFSPTGGNVGIGFAIPANTANQIVQQLLESGRVTRGWIGVSIQPLDRDIARSLGLDEPRGALVATVVPDGPAARAGIQQGDVILTFNGERIEDSRDLTQRVGATPIGNNSRIEVLRNGQRRTLNMRLQERPSEQQLAAANPPPSATPETPPESGGAGVAQSSLGLSVRPMTAEDRTRLGLAANDAGLVVTAVEPTSDAAQKGIGVGDAILQADQRALRTVQELSNAAQAAQRADRPILLQVATRGGRGFVAVDVAER